MVYKMNCMRCQEMDASFSYMSSRILTEKGISNLGLGYCNKCWSIIQFERAKYVSRPYKLPINRRGA